MAGHSKINGKGACIMKENERERLAEKQLVSEDIFAGRVLHLFQDTVELPNGKEAGREVVRHNGAVCIAAMAEDGRILVERQYRYPVDEVITELPAGKLDSPAEDPLAAAKRELKEETGAEAVEWTFLGYYYPAAAYCDEKIALYLAKGLTFGETDPDEDEFLDAELMPLADLVADILAGKVPDGKTQTLALRVAMMEK